MHCLGTLAEHDKSRHKDQGVRQMLDALEPPREIPRTRSITQNPPFAFPDHVKLCNMVANEVFDLIMRKYVSGDGDDEDEYSPAYIQENVSFRD